MHSLSSTNSLEYMQKMLQSTLSGSGSGTAATGFSSIMAELTVMVTETEEVADAPQTIDDVKREFYDHLDSLAVSPGLSGCSISIHVTDAAFEKMLADPEYKQKMKDVCARDICNPEWNKIAAMNIAPSAIVVTIDADCEEEYLASSYGSAVAPQNHENGSFWSRSANKDKKAEQKIMDEKAREKRELLNFLLEKATQRKIATDSALSYFVPQESSDAVSLFSGDTIF